MATRTHKPRYGSSYQVELTMIVSYLETVHGPNLVLDDLKYLLAGVFANDDPEYFDKDAFHRHINNQVDTWQRTLNPPYNANDQFIEALELNARRRRQKRA